MFKIVLIDLLGYAHYILGFATKEAAWKALKAEVAKHNYLDSYYVSPQSIVDKYSAAAKSWARVA